MAPSSQPGFPFGRIVKQPFHFLVWIFFCPRQWDTPLALVGHPPPSRQEPRIDPVGVAAARPPLARQNAVARKLGEMARGRTLADTSDLGELPHGREASPGTVGEADKALQRPAQMRLYRAIQVKDSRDKGKHGASGVQRTRPEVADFGYTLPVHAKRACEDSRFRG